MYLLDSLPSAIVLLPAALGLAGWFLFHRGPKKGKKRDKPQFTTQRRRLKESDAGPQTGNGRRATVRSDKSDNFGSPQRVRAVSVPLAGNEVNAAAAYQSAHPQAMQQSPHGGQSNGMDTTGSMTTSMAVGGATAIPRDYVVVREIQEIVPVKQRPRQQEDNIIDVGMDFDPGDITGQLRGQT